MQRLDDWVPDPAIGVEAWANDLYQCFVTYEEIGDVPWTHLSIKRHDRAPIHDWRDLQWIKNDIVGDEREAIELYPAESRLLDAANQFHLWVLPAGAIAPVGYFGGRAVMDEFVVPGSLGRQRPIPPERVKDGDRLNRQQRRAAARTIQKHEQQRKDAQKTIRTDSPR